MFYRITPFTFSTRYAILIIISIKINNMKKEKSTWAKGTTLDNAYDLGFIIGMRRTLQYLAEESIIEPTEIAYLLEEKYHKDIEKLK